MRGRLSCSLLMALAFGLVQAQERLPLWRPSPSQILAAQTSDQIILADTMDAWYCYGVYRPPVWHARYPSVEEIGLPAWKQAFWDASAFSAPEREEKAFLFAVRSNLLLPGLNLGVETAVGRHGSLGFDYLYPWFWPSPENKSCFELLACRWECRYWWNNRWRIPGSRGFEQLSGHSLGLAVSAACFDFERSFRGEQGEAVAFELGWKYACPLMSGRIHLECSLSIGVLLSESVPYRVFESGGKLIRIPGVCCDISYFGPMGAGVSLSVPVVKKEIL